jgi:cephalosporin-C deacetylase-like acetyl esterase
VNSFHQAILLLAIVAPLSAQIPVPPTTPAPTSTAPHTDSADFAELASNFSYDPEEPADLKQVSVERREGAMLYDITYASPRGGRVPAYVVVPQRGKGPLPAVLWAHWMMDGSPLRNRGEFLEEALVLARAGAASLLIDAPLVRPNVKEDDDPMSTQGIYASQQEVLDFRRGIDLLVARYNVDPKRIAFVGHSFGAHVGAILLPLDRRVKAAVLMTGGFADEEYVFRPDADQKMQTLRDRYGDEKVREFLHKYRWDDPVYYVGHSSPASVLLQFGKNDPPIPESLARNYYQSFGEPKKLAFYDAGHPLDAAARRDRAQFLREQLGLGEVDSAALDRIPQLK